MILNYKVTEKHFKYITILFFLIGFVFVLNKPIENVNDSDSYLDMFIIRSAGYPFFLFVLKYIFVSYFNIATIISQFLLGFFSIYFFITSIKKYYKLNSVWYILLMLIMLTPYVYNHHLANTFLSEALSYPLYLITMTYFLLSIITNRTKPLIVSLPILFILLLTRSQFMFLVPVAIFILLWVIIKQRIFKKNIWLLTVLLILPVITSITDKTYHKLKHGYFVNTPWTGIHLITPAFFVSDRDDYKIFEANEERLFFKEVYSKLYYKRLNINNIDKQNNTKNDLIIYVENYSEIANHTVFTTGKDLYGESLTNNEKIIAVDKLTKKMTFPLIIDNFSSWLKIYIKNFIYAFGNAKYFLIYAIILIFGFAGLMKKDGNDYRIITLLSLITIGNVALVAIGIHTIKRFTFYNDWTLFFIIFIFIETYIKHRRHTTNDD